MYRRIVTYFVTLSAAMVYSPMAANAQRMQFPSTAAQGPGAYPAPPSTYSPGTAVTSPPPTYAAPTTVGPPPTFDPYSTGTVGQPPAAVPYSYAPPGQTAAPVSPWQNYPSTPMGQPLPQQPGAVYPQGIQPPVGWQQGTWGFEDGYIASAQRLCQELGVEQTWLYGDHDVDDLGITRSEIYSTFAIPMSYTLDYPLLVTPGFAVSFLEGPVGDPDPADPDGPGPLPAPPRGPDLPPRLYDAYLDFAWYPQFNQFFGAELGVRTGIWSDFEHFDEDSIRILGRGLAKLSVTPQLDVLLGAVYLDRVRIKLLPAGGVYWRPTPEWDLYIVFPNPKARKQFTSVGNWDWFWYFAGEYGGGSWTVDRVGTPDRIDINDIRVVFGVEWETLTMIRGHVEAGYVFDREVIFADTAMPPVFDPDDTFMIRGGVDF